MIMFVPRPEGERERLTVNHIGVQPAPPSPAGSRTLIVEAKTEVGPVQLYLSAGDAARLMFEIGYALEQADRIARAKFGEAVKRA